MKRKFWFTKEPLSDQFFNKTFFLSVKKNAFHCQEPVVQWKVSTLSKIKHPKGFTILGSKITL